MSNEKSPPSVDKELHTEAILQELRKELRALQRQPSTPQQQERGATPPQKPEAAPDRLAQLVQELQARWQIAPHPFTSRLPLFGDLIARFRTLWNEVSTRWYVQPILQQQVDFNASVVRTAHQLHQQLKGLHEDLRFLRDETAEYDRMSVAVSRSLAQLDLILQNTEARLSTVQRHTEQSSLVLLETRVTLLEGMVRSGPPSTREVSGKGVSPAKPAVPFDYFGFEARFRGSPEQLKAKQRPYLDYFSGHAPVVDLGCGRGEFLELLQEAGTSARGVDLDSDMVAYCCGRGLEVLQGDALDFLAGQADGSLGGVFSAQVIEHLPPRTLVKLFQLCFQKLAPQGVLLAETINPMCLLALASHYTLDLSHEKPIHPDTAAFLAESTGFIDIEIRYTSPVPELGRLQPLAPTPEVTMEEWRAVLNRNAQKLNDFLFTYQDYALVARKPG